MQHKNDKLGVHMHCLKLEWGGRLARLGATLSVALVLGACASSYNAQMQGAMTGLKSGSSSNAVANLEQQYQGKKDEDKDLLYFLEKGELLRADAQFDKSRESLLVADGRVRAWEDEVKTNPGKLLGDVGSFVVNDTTRRYDGRDYEKVMVSVRLALDHMALSDWDNARVEITKMHERETVIADFRAKDLEDAQKRASSKGVRSTNFKDIKGYPVETLEDPQVRALTNSYESAFANYLAGFLYESLGEPSLASAGYRKASEMVPNNPLIDSGLGGLDGRVSAARRGNKGEADTLIVLENGYAPAIVSQRFALLLPIPSTSGVSMVWTAISWPTIPAAPQPPVPVVTIDGNPVPFATLTNIDLMARRALSDEMPGIMARSAVRAIAKGAAQKVADDHAQSLGMFGLIASAAIKVASVVSEQADERTWRSLPGTYSIGRLSLSRGPHTLTVMTATGPRTVELKVGGRQTLVDLRMMGDNVAAAQSFYPQGALAVAPLEVAPPPPVVSAPAADAKPVKADAKPVKKDAKDAKDAKAAAKPAAKPGDAKAADAKAAAKPADAKAGDAKPTDKSADAKPAPAKAAAVKAPDAVPDTAMRLPPKRPAAQTDDTASRN
jgi:hypothetical protein